MLTKYLIKSNSNLLIENQMLGVTKRARTWRQGIYPVDQLGTEACLLHIVEEATKAWSCGWEFLLDVGSIYKLSKAYKSL
jgi:hypothetical protein